MNTNRVTRRDLVKGAGMLAAAQIAVSPVRADVLPPTAGLNDHAKRAGMLFGSAVTAETLVDAEGDALYAREVGIVTSDLELKFAWLRPDRDTFNFAGADAILSWAERHRVLVRGHCLIWNEYSPDWLKRCSAREVERIFDEHIERVVSRYIGRIHTWDVVNEPFWPDHGETGGFRRGPWYNALGPGYVARALKRVRALDKTVKLCVNEAFVEGDNPWGVAIRPLLARLVHDLRQSGVPIDAVGLQCHLHPEWPHDYERFATYCNELAANAVDLHVTEFDVYDASYPDAPGLRDQKVASFATGFLKPVLAIPAIKMLITWELADRLSWYWHQVHDADPQPKRSPRPLPFDEDFQRKPLWTALAEGFDRRAAGRAG